MPKGTDSLLNYIRAVAGVWRNDPRDDTELLARFVETRDEVAFTALVDRHGALVWQTCRRLLGNTPDAEDAFQTAFLALSRKAGLSTIKNPAGWLHRVARQTALKTRSGIRRRLNLEQKVQALTKPEAEENADRAKLYEGLDEELANLPERLRLPLLLHYLGAKSQEQVASILGCSRRTIRERLEKGKAILRKRLELRGMTLGAMSVAAMLSNTASAPAMPAGLIASTARAAVAFRAGILTGASADAAEKLLRGLSWKGVMSKGWWVVLACVGFLGVGGVGLIAWEMSGSGSDVVAPAVVPAVPKTAPPKPKTVAEQRNERLDRFGDPLPEGALARIGTLRFRLSGGDSDGGIVFLPDGRTLISYAHRSLYFWEWATGKLLRRLDGVGDEGGFGRKIAVSPDGKMLVIGGEYWDLTTNPPRKLAREEVPTLMSAGGVAFSHDGKTVAWAGCVKKKGKPDQCCVYLVDASTGKVKITLKDVEGRHLAFSPDDKTLAIGDGEMHIADTMGGELALWDVATGVKRLQIARIGNAVTFLAFLSGGRTLLEFRLIGGDLGEMMESNSSERIRFLDAVTGKEQHSVDGVHISRPFCRRSGTKCLSSDGKLLAANEGKAISVWDMATGREVGPIAGIHLPVDTLAFSPDCKKLVTLSGWAESTAADCHLINEFHIWETDTGRLERELVPEFFLRMIASVHYDARHLEILCAKPCNLPLFSRPPFSPSEKIWGLLRWDTATEKTEEVKERIPANLVPMQKKSPCCCAVSSDGRWQALGLDHGIALVDRATGKEARHITDTKDPCIFVTFAADGQSVLTCVGSEETYRLEVRSVATGKQRISLSNPLEPDNAVSRPSWPDKLQAYALSSDGRWLAAAVDGGSAPGRTVRILEVASGIEEDFNTSGDTLRCVAWSLDGRFLAGGDANGAVWIRDVLAGREVRRFTGHLGEVTTLAFSPDGLRLASGGTDTMALVWDLCGLSHPEAREKGLPTADALWAALGEKDPVAARRSIHLLTQMPDAALPLLRERLWPALVPYPQQVAKLLTQLDNENFRIRKQAEKQLEKMGDGIEPALQTALAKKPSLEVRQRINNVLNKVLGPCVGPSGLNSGQLRACRGVEVLERIGTPAARQVLEELSRLPGELIQSEEANAALQRLAKPPLAPTP